eukprot:TRINITY_DN14967_c0_g1_i1.p1 TRINITY_DN14967_c0_g1~~TRINITY_DN14967_c0_g1_i1.p1  ORF type:complete len:468 (-),score=87.63 TRINITY_DN14967_c0_g1_i1:130-1479(-)
MTATNIQACAAAASLVDGIDLGLFPASFKSLELDLQLSPEDLGRLSMLGGLTSCFCAVIWGFLADNYNRRSILVAATAALGAITLGTGYASNHVGLALTRVLAGAVVAATGPTTQSLIAEAIPRTERGGAFALTAVAGSMSAAASAYLPAILGWRMAYHLMGVTTISLSIVLLRYQQDMDQHKTATNALKMRTTEGMVAMEMDKVKQLFYIPTFWAILVGGIFGCIPWNALQFLMMYYETIGFTPIAAGTLISCAAVGRAVGCFGGGHLGDFLAAKSPNHGRAFAAQATILLGMGSLYIILRVVPPSTDYFHHYALANVSFGLVASWCNPAVDRPLWSEIVPANCRGTVISWWTFIAGSFGCVFGAPLVGFLAEHMYGYSLVEHRSSDHNPENVHALSSSLLICTMVPWAVCFCFYSLIHVTYSRDVAPLPAVGGPAGKTVECPLTDAS